MPRSDWIHSGVCCIARDRFLNVVEHLLPGNNAQPKHAAGKHECILGFAPAPDTFDLSIPCPFERFGVGSVFGSTVVERGYQQYSLEIYYFIRNTQEKQILENTAKTQTGPQWKREDKYITRKYWEYFPPRVLGNSASGRSGKFEEGAKPWHMEPRTVFCAKQQLILYNIIL